MKNYSSTYLATFIAVAAQILPLLGIEVGTEALTTTVQTIIMVCSGIWILKERFARGDITVAGVRK